MRQPPKKFRRLTKAEALKLGVSHKAKRRVDASLKKVTKQTKLYTDRQVAEIKLGTKKENYSQFRVSPVMENGMRAYRNIHPNEHFKLQKIAGVRQCQILAYGVPKYQKRVIGGSAHEGGGETQQFVRSYGFEGFELKHNLDALYSVKGWLGYSADNPPTRVDVIIYAKGFFA